MLSRTAILAILFFFQSIAFSQVIKNNDLTKIPSLLPTMYHMAIEARTSCKGKYRGTVYKGHERTDVKNADGEVIKTVCTRFYRELLMEGSGWLGKDGEDIIPVNYDKKIKDGDHRFRRLGDCAFGEGIDRDLCLIPHHTIAADLKKHDIGDILYIPRAKGLELPDGRQHNGLFVVRDTGGAFINIGKQRVDLYVGTQIDHDNVFQKEGFHHRRKEKAFRLKGQSKENAEKWFEETFPELW